MQEGAKKNAKHLQDGTKSVSETDRRSGQMAVSTKQVNNQIENKLNRLCKQVCCLHAACVFGLVNMMRTFPVVIYGTKR